MPETGESQPVAAVGTGETVNEARESAKLPDAKTVIGKWQAGVKARSEVDKETWTNIAFIKGDHYLHYDAVAGKFRRPETNDGRARLRVNLLKAFWRGEVSTMVEADPISEVIPASPEDRDRKAAEAGNRILAHEFERLRWRDLRFDLARWISAAGLGYLYVYWDRNAEQVRVDVVPHFEVVQDPAVVNHLDEGLWVIHGKAMTKEEAFEKFGKEFKEDSTTAPLMWGSMFGRGASGGTSTGGGTSKKGVLVLQMWHRPSNKYPDGFVITVVGEEVFEVKPFPYEHKMLPFIDFHHIRIPGRYEGQSMLVDLIPAQKDYNQSRSRMAEIRTVMAFPKVFAPEGSLDTDRISNIPGEVVFYRPIGPYRPEPVPMPPVPGFLFQTADVAYREMQDIAGQHEVSRGQVPASGIPAAGIAALQEVDERKVATTIQALERGTAVLGKHILGLVQQFWDLPRAVRVWSEETGKNSVQFFKGADLVNSLDVWVLPGSGIPRNKAQQRQDAIALWRERVIQDPKVLLKLMEFPSPEGALMVFDSDTKQAQRENQRIAEGDVPTAEGWHNHGVHISEHNEFRKSEEFEDWPDEAKAAMADHVTEHEVRQQEELEKQAMQAMQAAMGAQGGVSGVPTQDLPGEFGGGPGSIPGVNAPVPGQFEE